jgi:hypothetical protein
VTRRLPVVSLLALALVLLAWPDAIAKDLGTDVLGNISPDPALAGGGSLVDQYPLSAFSLDYHTQVGITQLDGVPPTIAHWAAAQIWSLTSFLVKTVINLFTWAFSLNLLSGDATGGGGALAPVARAISSLYENVVGEAWMVAAIVLAGIWGIWKALVQRRYTETAGALALSVVFVLIALFFVYQPERTIGTAGRWTNTLSLAFLSGANRGTVDDPGQAKRQVSDQLFETLLYQPWVVLEFGGMRHCVDTTHRDSDGYPRPVSPHDPSANVCRDHLRQGRDAHGGYAPRFLRHPAGSSERNAEYDALRKGQTPAGDPQFNGYAVDKSDSPAVDIQQEHGAFQRLTLSVVMFASALGAVVLLGFLSLAVILAQVVALVLLGFAPVALVIGIFPRAGHDFFRTWLGKLATAVFIKALYSLVIAIVVAVAAALAAATGSLGFLFAFGLQGIFFWAIFLYRRQITARLVAATTGLHHQERLPQMRAMQRGAEIAGRPFGALLALPRRGGREESNRQESALAGGAPAPAPSGESAPDAPAAAPVTRNGNGSFAGQLDHVASNGSGAHPRPVRRAEAVGEPTPRDAHEDVLRRARALREVRDSEPAREEQRA